MYYPDDHDAVSGSDFNPVLEPVAKSVAERDRYAHTFPLAYDISESYGVSHGIVFAESYPVGKSESKPITYGVAELASEPKSKPYRAAHSEPNADYEPKP